MAVHSLGLPALTEQIQALERDLGTLLLRRTIDGQGKSRAWINGGSATIGQLREIPPAVSRTRNSTTTPTIRPPNSAGSRARLSLNDAVGATGVISTCAGGGVCVAVMVCTGGGGWVMTTSGGGMKGGGGASSLGGGGKGISGGGGGLTVSSMTLVSIGARTTSTTLRARPLTSA